MANLDFNAALGDQAAGRKVRITFKRESARIGPRYLLGMKNGGLFTMERSDEGAMMAVGATGDWSTDRNRTTVLTLTAKFDREWFEGRMNRELESIVHVQ